MQTAIFLPPLPRMSGGLAVLLQLGGHVARAGHDVSFVVREKMNLPLHLAGVPVRHWEDMRLGAEHVWVVPEGWTNALAPGLTAGAHCLVYVQNWAFALGVLPEGTRWENLPVEFVHVSEPVRWFMSQATGKDGPVLRPGIDLHRFAPPVLEDAAAPVCGPVRVAWMPRKNKALAQQIRHCVEERLQRVHPTLALEWVEIHQRTPQEVAEILHSSHIFLATGFPEGCPLPPLEAMASGCVVVGFSGLGGWDYMRQADDSSYLCRPWWPLRATEWDEGGNGFYVADADVPAAVLALEEACLTLSHGGPKLALLRTNVALTARAYSLEAQALAVARLWEAFTI